MLKRIIITGLLLGSVISASGQEKKSNKVYKLYNLSASEVLVTCKNGADPTFRNVAGNTVMVSCGAVIKASWDGKKFVCPADAPFEWADEGEALKGSDAFVYCGTHALLNK